MFGGAIAAAEAGGEDAGDGLEQAAHLAELLGAEVTEVPLGLDRDGAVAGGLSLFCGRIALFEPVAHAGVGGLARLACLRGSGLLAVGIGAGFVQFGRSCPDLPVVVEELVEGLLLCGSFGEGGTQSELESLGIFEIDGAEGAQRIPFFAGAGAEAFTA